MTSDPAPPRERPSRSFWQVGLLAAGLLILVFISAYSVVLVQRAQEDAAAITHTIEVENQISLVLLQLRRAESAERGFIIRQTPDLLADFREAEAQVMPVIERLQAQVADNPVQRKNIADMLAAARNRVAELSRVVETARAGNIESARASIGSSAGREMTERIRTITVAMRDEEERLLALRTAAAQRSQTMAAAVTILGSVLVILLGLLSAFLVRRSQQLRDKAEAQLRDINVNLEAAVTERTADLREANEEIQRFAYIVSHDLRSPLVNIMGFTSELDELRGDIFRRFVELDRAVRGENTASDASDATAGGELQGADKQLADDFSEAINFIKSSIAKMDRLISAILNLTRAGRRPFNPEPIDVKDLIDTIVSTVAHQAMESETEIRVEELPDIVSDRLALEQIFSNLIDNALKYLKTGVPGRIVIRGRRKLGFAIFEVADNGRGIDPKDHQRIFELFRRAGAQDRPGQGIGLAHVRALVRRMGGSMSVSSELNNGSTFTITLPLNWVAERPEKDA